MGSVSKRLRRGNKGRDRKLTPAAVRRRLAECVLFGDAPAPTSDHCVERSHLTLRFQQALAEFGETKPAKFWGFLKEHRRGWDPAHDGQSKLMAFVDDVAALKEDEREYSTNP